MFDNLLRFGERCVNQRLCRNGEPARDKSEHQTKSAPRAGKIMTVENSLAQYSINTPREIKLVENLPQEDALKRIEQNFLAYDNEVLRDETVSIKYSYWFGPENKLYLHSSLRPEDSVEKGFDPDEREGKFIEGFQKTADLLRNNPNKVVLWYSPPGRAAFVEDPDNKFSQIKFIYGQLYIQYFDGEKINAAAVKINEKEATEEIIPTLHNLSVNFDTEQLKTYFFLRHPVLTGLSINDFLDKDWGNVKVYKDKEGETHRLHEIFQEIRSVFSGEKRLSSVTSGVIGQLRVSGISEETLFKGYMSLINYEMGRTGRNYIQLAGSCGGKTISKDTVLSLLGFDSPLQNLFSSDFRVLSKENNSNHYPDYECPHCHKVLTGESKTDESSWRKKCDHCGGALKC